MHIVWSLLLMFDSLDQINTATWGILEHAFPTYNSVLSKTLRILFEKVAEMYHLIHNNVISHIWADELPYWESWKDARTPTALFWFRALQVLPAKFSKTAL